MQPAVPPNASLRDEAKPRDTGLHAFGSRRILGLRVDASSYGRAVEAILEMAATGGGVTCVATVHMLMEAYDDPGYGRILNASELVTSDGMPLVWALRALGLPQAERVYGPDLTPALCAAAASCGVPVGFYGGTPEVLDALSRALLARFAGLRIAFRHSPPFRALTAEEDAQVVDAIRESGTRILFVGLGCPGRSAGWRSTASGSTAPRWASAPPSTSWRATSARPRAGSRAPVSSGCSAWCASRAACGVAMRCTIRASW